MQQFQELPDIIPRNKFFEFMKILIHNTAKLWQVWYIHHDLRITDKHILLNYLTRIKTIIYSEPIKDPKTDTFNYLLEIFSDDGSRGFVNQYTNFYDLYMRPTEFIYNLRHIQPDHINEIVCLLQQSRTITCSIEFSRMIAVMHYPSDDFLNIFHIQLYPKNYASEDMAGTQIEASLTRGYLLDKYIHIENNYFMNKDIVLTLKVLGERNKHIKNTEKYKRLYRIFEKTRVELFKKTDGELFQECELIKNYE